MKIPEKILTNRSTILTIAACGGVIGTGYLAYKAGEKHAKTANQYPPVSSPLIYIPPIVIGGLTICAIVLSHRLDAKKIVALTAAAGYITANRDEIEKQIEERYGKDALKEIKQQVSAIVNKDRITVVAAEETGYGDTLVIDEYSGRLFRSSLDAVEKGIAEFCDEHSMGRPVSLNRLYEKWGIIHTSFGTKFGFPNDPMYYDTPLVIEASLIKADDIAPWVDAVQYEKFGEDFILVEWFTYPMEDWDSV